MPLNDAALVRRRQEILAHLRSTTAAAVAKVWDSLDSYTDDQIEAFIRRASPAVAAGQERAFWLSVAHLQRLLGDEFQADIGLLSTAEVDLKEPFIALGRALNAGNSIEDAIAAGRARAEAVADSGVQWASTRASQSADGDNRIIGWTRALDGKACDWCREVSRQIYRTAETASFGHTRCGCSVEPVIGDRDPGRALNRQRDES